MELTGSPPFCLAKFHGHLNYSTIAASILSKGDNGIINAMKLFAVALTTLAMSGVSFAQAKPLTPATPARPATPAVPGTEKAKPATPATPATPAVVGADKKTDKVEDQAKGKAKAKAKKTSKKATDKAKATEKKADTMEKKAN